MMILIDSEGDPVEREVTCEAGADSSPNEGNNGLICTSEGDPVEREESCEEGEEGICKWQYSYLYNTRRTIGLSARYF